MKNISLKSNSTIRAIGAVALVLALMGSFMLPGTVNAADPDGIDALRLWIDESYYGITKTEPYQFTVTGMSAGDHTLMVRVRDTLYNANNSETITIEVENTSSIITHVGTTKVYDSDGQNLTIARPSGSKAGDLLILVLHRTDDDLPLYVNGWTRVAECFKRNNGYDCSIEEDCIRWHNEDYCADFGGHGGHDLAQSVFFRKVDSSEANSYTFNLNRDTTGHPGWAILTALRGADANNPVRDWSYKGCDESPDSVFPSVYGEEGDILLLSQSFDDAIAQTKFGAPSSTTLFGYVSKSDEAGFLFGGVLASTGQTGQKTTVGDGGPNCKDALVSLTIKPQYLIILLRK